MPYFAIHRREENRKSWHVEEQTAAILKPFSERAYCIAVIVDVFQDVQAINDIHAGGSDLIDGCDYWGLCSLEMLPKPKVRFDTDDVYASF